MTEYEVSWAINVNESDPRTTIKQALEHMTRPGTTANVFEVREKGGKERVMVIDLGEGDDPIGQPVWNREGTEFGIATGATRKCRMEGCPSRRIVTRWPSGRVTMPCARAMDFGPDGYRIK